MLISKKIRELLMPRARGTGVRDVRIGLRYTAVLLKNGQAGVAYTFHEKIKGGCPVFRYPGNTPIRSCCHKAGGDTAYCE